MLSVILINMENSDHPTPSQKDTQRPLQTANSIDGFARPTRPPASTSGVVSSITLPPSGLNSSPQSSDIKPKSDHTESHAAPALSAPMTSGNLDHRRSKLWTIILVLLILIVFVGGLYGIYTYQQKKINNQSAQVSNQSLQVASLKSQINKLESTPVVSINTQSASSTALTLFKVPELDTSFSVPSNLADLSYVLNSTKTQANLSTENLATLDSGCAASATVAPLGSIAKGTGQYPAAGTATTTLIKQYQSYYIAYVKPAGNCSTVTQINALVNVLISDFKNTFSTVAVTS
jgi:cbb3-type cytochrome oxidase subunit 3